MHSMTERNITRRDAFGLCHVPPPTHTASSFIPALLYNYTTRVLFFRRDGMWRRLTNDKLALLGEFVCGNLEVERGGTLSYTAGDIVVRTVARAEPTAVVTGLTNGDTSQVGADT